jgi:hypothetical protein
MTHLRRIALVAVALTLSVAPVAVGQSQPNSGPVVAPADKIAGLTGGELLRDSWAQLLSLPIAENPFNGHCQALAGGKVRVPIAFGLDPSVPITCAAGEGDSLFLRFGTVCTNVEKPPYYGADEAAQIECARASNRHIRAIDLTVDGGLTVSIRQARFEIVSPQGTVQLPADNILGVPPQTVTFTAVAWGSLVSKLDRGQHTTRFHVKGDGFDATYTTIVDVT